MTMGGASFSLCFAATTQCGACNCRLAALRLTNSSSPLSHSCSGSQQSVSACVVIRVDKCMLEVQAPSVYLNSTFSHILLPQVQRDTTIASLSRSLSVTWQSLWQLNPGAAGERAVTASTAFVAARLLLDAEAPHD